MNMLSITINGSTILIVLLILVFMAIIGYYADKTKYSKEYKKKQESKKDKKIDLANTRINDLVGEKKDILVKETEQDKNIENSKNNTTAIVNEQPNEIPQELFTPAANTTTNETLTFDDSEKSTSSSEKLTFDETPTQVSNDNLIFDKQTSATSNESLNFDSQSSETLTFDSEPESKSEETHEEVTIPAIVEEKSKLEEEQNNESTEQAVNDTENVLTFEEPTVESSNIPMAESQTEKEKQEISEDINKDMQENNINKEIIASDETLDLDAIISQANESEFETTNNKEVESVAPVDEYFEMDKDLEQKLKADILESIKSVEEDTPATTANQGLESFVQSSDIPKSTAISLDDDLGISELPKLKIDKEESDTDKLSVDDIFKI